MPTPFPNLHPARRGRVERPWHSSQVLRDNGWEDPADRELIVYLPPGYDDAKQSYPAVMILAGFSGNGEAILSRGLSTLSIATRIDQLIARGCPPFIAVLPDCMTSLGGSQYVDSPALGQYATYCASELRTFTDAHYRTTGRWGVAGHSSGGFGALHLAMRFPGAFHAVASHAGDMGFDLCYLSDIPKAISGVAAAGGMERFLQTFWDQRDPSPSAFAALNLAAMACAYSPDPELGPLPARLPVDIETGAMDFEVFQIWRRFDPVYAVDDPAAAEALRRLDLLYLDAGDKDEHHLQLGLRRFVSRLVALEISHQHREFPGTHKGLSWRYETSLPLIVDALS